MTASAHTFAFALFRPALAAGTGRPRRFGGRLAGQFLGSPRIAFQAI